MCLISMGNPHIVLSARKKLTPMEISRAAGHFQRENPYGHEANVEVITDVNFQDRSVFAVVKERGAGFTLACGTGGGAIIRSLIEREIAKRGEKWSVFFPGGSIKYIVDNDDLVTTEGIPQKVFNGEVPVVEDSVG
jgi:diaminopimelate epimerase